MIKLMKLPWSIFCFIAGLAAFESPHVSNWWVFWGFVAWQCAGIAVFCEQREKDEAFRKRLVNRDN